MFFNWYLGDWWAPKNGSCLADDSVEPEDLANLVKSSLSLDHFPRIEDERVDERNVGNIVSNFCKCCAFNIRNVCCC